MLGRGDALSIGGAISQRDDKLCVLTTACRALLALSLLPVQKIDVRIERHVCVASKIKAREQSRSCVGVGLQREERAARTAARPYAGRS